MNVSFLQELVRHLTRLERRDDLGGVGSLVTALELTEAKRARGGTVYRHANGEPLTASVAGGALQHVQAYLAEYQSDPEAVFTDEPDPGEALAMADYRAAVGVVTELLGEPSTVEEEPEEPWMGARPTATWSLRAGSLSITFGAPEDESAPWYVGLWFETVPEGVST